MLNIYEKIKDTLKEKKRIIEDKLIHKCEKIYASSITDKINLDSLEDKESVKKFIADEDKRILCTKKRMYIKCNKALFLVGDNGELIVIEKELPEEDEKEYESSVKPVEFSFKIRDVVIEVEDRVIDNESGEYDFEEDFYDDDELIDRIMDKVKELLDEKIESLNIKKYLNDFDIKDIKSDNEALMINGYARLKTRLSFYDNIYVVGERCLYNIFLRNLGLSKKEAKWIPDKEYFNCIGGDEKTLLVLLGDWYRKDIVSLERLKEFTVMNISEV